MPQHVSPSKRLSALLGALVAPWEFETIDHWRDHIGRETRDCVGAQHSQVSLDPVCGLASIRSPDVDPALIRDYQRHWITRDLFADFLARRGIPTYVRSAIAGQYPAFGATYHASPILNEFYRTAGLHDAAGVLRRHPQLAQLTVFTTHRTNPRFARRARRIMPLVSPAFLAGAQQILNLSSVRGHFARNIDALHLPIALYDTAGRAIHHNTALAALRAAHAEALPSLDSTLGYAARVLAAVSLEPDSGRQLAVATAGGMSWQWREHTVAGSIARLGIDGSPPLIMLQVCTHAGVGAPSALDAEPGADGAPLTRREREVAGLLAGGAANRAIAATLGVSEHTARRHTERVLRKLCLTSRSGVARALGLLRTPGGPDA